MERQKQRLEWLIETIAVFRRQSDGIELHLSRDGHGFYRIPLEEKPWVRWEPAGAGLSLGGIEAWRRQPPGDGFIRVDLPSADEPPSD